MKRYHIFSTCRHFALLALFLCLYMGTHDAMAISIPERDDDISKLDTQSDSLVLAKINSRMDSIRTWRPTVGLVLSGGGARGAAHVGVIKYLEECGIPVDLVVGTSMGGLIGGLYAMDYSPEQMDSILLAANWPEMMQDRIPRKYIPYHEMRDKERFLISFPFHYEDEEHQAVGNSFKQNISGRFKERLMSAIPSGYIYGHNVDKTIKGLTIGHHDSLSFDILPRPYACVATDLVTAKGKVWYSGSLPVAMRSTMSIPGVFSPVRTGGMVLVDGGMRNNYPADIARDMGADILIGVDLNKGYEDYSEIKNLVNIFNASVGIMGRKAYERNSNLPDVTIKPQLAEFNMMDFDTRSIETIIARGYEAAKNKSEELSSILDSLGTFPEKIERSPDMTMDTKMKIVSCHIHGVTGKEEKMIINLLSGSQSHEMSRRDIEDIEDRLIGTGSFENISYELLKEKDGYTLMLDCSKAPVHQFGVGFRFDTEEMMTAIAEAGFNENRIGGSKHRIGMKFSANPQFSYLFSIDNPRGPTFNAGINVRWTDMNLLDFSHGDRPDLNFLHCRQNIHLSNIKWNYLDMQLGIGNDLWYFPESGKNGLEIGNSYCNGGKWTDCPNIFFKMRAYTFNDSYFPTKGIDGGLSYQWTFGNWTSNEGKWLDNFHSIRADIKGAVSICERLTILPSVEFSAITGNSVPCIYGNYVGGTIRGRYVDQQVPFPGINGLVPTLPFLGVFSTSIRVEVFKDHFLTGQVGYAREAAKWNEWFQNTSDYLGVILEYSYDSPIGPISLNIHWSDLSPLKNKFGFYLNIGFHF